MTVREINRLPRSDEEWATWRAVMVSMVFSFPGYRLSDEEAEQVVHDAIVNIIAKGEFDPKRSSTTNFGKFAYWQLKSAKRDFLGALFHEKKQGVVPLKTEDDAADRRLTIEDELLTQEIEAAESKFLDSAFERLGGRGGRDRGAEIARDIIQGGVGRGVEKEERWVRNKRRERAKRHYPWLRKEAKRLKLR